MADVIVALDYPSADEALTMVERLGPPATFYKVGLELYTRGGPSFVESLATLGKRVFLDLKLHDIPTTVAGAVRSASALGVDLLTVHTAGGPAMLEAAADASGRQLRVLGLARTGITDAGLKHLATIKSLREVWIYPTRVSDGAVDELKTALPGVRVIY